MVKRIDVSYSSLRIHWLHIYRRKPEQTRVPRGSTEREYNALKRVLRSFTEKHDHCVESYVENIVRVLYADAM